MNTHAQDRARQPKGRPTGGEFAEQAKPASGVMLGADAPPEPDERGRVSIRAQDLPDHTYRFLVDPLGARVEIVDQVEHSSVMPGLITVPTDLGTLFVDAEADIEVSDFSRDQGATSPPADVAAAMMAELARADHTRPDYPDAEHKALVQALQAYRDAANGTKVTGRQQVPMFVQAHIYPDPTPLPQWPRGVPEPRVGFDLDDGRVTTLLALNTGSKGSGDRYLALWTDSGDTHDNRHDRDASDPDHVFAGISEEDADQIMEWAVEVHRRIDAAAYGAQSAAVNHPGLQDTVLDSVLGDDRRT